MKEEEFAQADEFLRFFISMLGLCCQRGRGGRKVLKRHFEDVVKVDGRGIGEICETR